MLLLVTMNMPGTSFWITPEQAQDMIAVHEHGSFLRAAEFLGKRHTAIMKSIKKLELLTGLKILDRSEYRVKLTDQGFSVLETCKKMHEIQVDFLDKCHELKTGSEPVLKIVMDGIIPIEPMLDSLSKLQAMQKFTHIQFITEYHQGVEEAFIDQNAHLMFGVIPPQKMNLDSIELKPIESWLVASSKSEIHSLKNPDIDALSQFSFLTVRGSHSLLNLSTAMLDSKSVVRLNNFEDKKAALLKNLGFGWMPKKMIIKNCRSGKLKKVVWEGGNVHFFTPKVYFRNYQRLGKNAKALIKLLTS